MMMLYLPSGSPTAELFAASYNTIAPKERAMELELGTYGYTNNTDWGWLKTTDNHDIYNKDSSISWYLASPNNQYCSNVEIVSGSYGYFLNASVGITPYPVRPLVCIPTSVFNSKYATSTTLVDE